MINLPLNNQWQTSLDSDLFGSVTNTKNVDFDKKGYISLARKAMSLYNEDQRVSDDFKIPQVIVADDDYAYVITTDHAFAVDLSDIQLNVYSIPTGGATPSFSTNTDGVFYQGLGHFSGTQTVATYSGGTGGTWSQKITGLSNQNPHPLCVMENRQTLLVGDGNVLKQYSSTYVLDSANTLTIPNDYIIEWVRYRQSTAVVGTRNINGGEAKIFLWNGTGVGFQTAYGIGCDWAYSGCEYGSSIAVIASSGRLLRFNGAGFDELATLPVWATPYPWTSDSSRSNINGQVASRGMQAHGNILYLNIDGSLDINQGEEPGKYLPNQPSGLWEYDPKVGLSHKAGYVYDHVLRLIPTAINSGYLTFATPHQAQTGDTVLYSGTGTLTGLNFHETYYAIVGGANAIKLALSPSEALAGIAVNVGGTISTDEFTFDTYTSVGASIIGRAGPIMVLGNPHLNTFYGTEVLFTGGVMVGNDERYALMSLGSGHNIGSFTSPKIQSASVTDTLQKLYAKFPPLNLDTDKIVVKYRNSERFGYPLGPSIYEGYNTWTSSNTFTVDTTKFAFKLAQIGDEIEVLSGQGSGYTAHITAIDTSSSLYTVTIDENLPVSNGQIFDFTVNNWTKYQTLTNDSERNADGFGEIAIGAKSTWFQFKIEMRGRDISLYTLEFINSGFKLKA